MTTRTPDPEPKRHWNYRVMRSRDLGEYFYSIHEVYYLGAEVENWSREAARIVSEEPDFRGLINKLLEARLKPILDYETGKPIE